MLRVMIADDHQMFIDGIRSLLAGEPEMEVVAHALDGQEILTLLEQQPADIVLMDITMPHMSGIEATRIIRQKYPHIHILMLTMHEGVSFIREVMEAGASGYILKNTDKKELMRAIGTVAAGGKYFGMQVTAALVQHMQQQAAAPADPQPELSGREREILRLITREYTTPEIAEALSIGVQTVETHRKNLLRKLNARNIAGLVRYALENGLAD